MPYKFLRLEVVEEFVPAARKLGVSKVARGPRGFLREYRFVFGSPSWLDPKWLKKRENFIKRHLAEAKARGEKLTNGRVISRRHLALIMWAYSPSQGVANNPLLYTVGKTR